uniref:Protein GrpE n=1 Tax=Candidatus Kentrum sp. TC TaxID=2126339 RepID=A0A451A441_9GAMM|nr:MAG: molecular chaperone GrpE [Candidatus Kentron sp. TC]VFK49100.1 MAG: molecular chaperone GrpE [Candidatus Kentron sp. TC]VFK60819.1 MAG: molecular chaperone GrpE [Candidatus Kentron sp. TC]
MVLDQHIPREHQDQEIPAEQAPSPDRTSSETPSPEKPITDEPSEAEDIPDDAPEMTDPPKQEIEDSDESTSSANDTTDDSVFDDLANRLMVAERKAEEHRDNALRLQAEMENLRKRSAREVENAHKYGLDRFISELLPVKDSLELGIVAACGENADMVAIREGMELTLKMFGNAMGKFGVEEVSPSQGERFDPGRHQAMSVQEDEEKESGTISMVMQKGYLLNGRLVRPAMVIVTK